MAGGGSMSLAGSSGPSLAFLPFLPLFLCFSEVLDFVLTFLQ